MLDDFKNALEPYRVPEAMFQTAYEGTPARCAALVKTALALSAFHFPPCPTREDKQKSSAWQGFSERIIKTPAEGALLFFDTGCTAMARVCACAVLPALAGVTEIFAICIGDEPSPYLLATLELCGIENVYLFPDATELLSAASPVRPAESLIPALVLADSTNRLDKCQIRRLVGENPCFFEKTDPRIAVLEPDAFNQECFRFALGGTPLDFSCRGPGFYAAVYGTREQIASLDGQKIQASLFLEPGCEGFWLFPHIYPGFFQKTERFFAFAEGGEDGLR